jgi:hypothetical protein
MRKTGSANSQWNDNGYIYVYNRDYPSMRGGRVRFRVAEHVLVMEQILGGMSIPPYAVIHHLNGISSDNRPENLAILPGLGAHRVLHRRVKAFEACGNPDWRRCWVCKTYDDPKNMHIHKTGSHGNYHMSCAVDYNKRLLEKKKEVQLV